MHGAIVPLLFFIWITSLDVPYLIDQKGELKMLCIWSLIELLLEEEKAINGGAVPRIMESPPGR